MVFFIFFYQTPLHIAARVGNKTIVDLLIKYGAKLNKIDNNDEIPLFIAIKASCVECIDRLLEGFQMNTTNRKKQTALHLACISANTEIAKKILDYFKKDGANINARDVFGNTPLHYATMADNPDIINVLLDSKVDATIRNVKGKSPFFYASVEAAKSFRQHFQDAGALDALSNSVRNQRSQGAQPQSTAPKRYYRHASPSYENNQASTPPPREPTRYSVLLSKQSSPTSSSPLRSPKHSSQETPSPKWTRHQTEIPQNAVSKEEFESFRTEIKSELDDINQKIGEIIRELKHRTPEPHVPPSIEEVKRGSHEEDE